MPDSPSAVLVCRYRGLNDPSPSVAGTLAGSAIVADPGQVKLLADAFNRLPTTGPGVNYSVPIPINCPFDDSAVMLALFGYQDGSTDAIRIQPTGCGQASNGYVIASLGYPPGFQLIVDLNALTGCPPRLLCWSDALPPVAMAVPHDQHANHRAYSSVFRVYAKHRRRIPRCAFGLASLRAARAETPKQAARYAPGFPKALRQAIHRAALDRC